MVTRFRVVMIPLVLVLAGALFAQEELPFLGRYDDFRFIKQPKDDSDQIIFARLIYNGRIPAYYKNWYTDYPKSDELLIHGIKRLTNLNMADEPRAVPLNDPDLFKYPFLYTSEPGQMVFSDKDAATMREYLARGGFWVMDDFWGSWEWNAMETQLRKVLPTAKIEDIPRDHPIFHVFYDIDKIIQIPSLAFVYNGGITYEYDGFQAFCKGVWDEQGRLVAVINHNTDLGDAYEWADEPKYPNHFSSYAYRVAINFILYSLTH
jgi:hypothetical protein